MSCDIDKEKPGVCKCLDEAVESAEVADGGCFDFTAEELKRINCVAASVYKELNGECPTMFLGVCAAIIANLGSCDGMTEALFMQMLESVELDKSDD